MTWFGLQVVVSCATTWINYVATGSLQSSKHNLRFPLVLCVVFLLVPPVLETFRLVWGTARIERDRWECKTHETVEVEEVWGGKEIKGYLVMETKEPEC
jgi:hypothetical protein